MSFFSRLKTPIYKNTGSVARDHLAAERTFLAWIRTGLGLVALGTAIERFSRVDMEAFMQLATPASTTASTEQHKHTSDREKTQEHILAATLLGTGSGSIAYGVGRYFSNLRLLEQGLYKPSYFGAGALGLTMASVAGAVYWTGFRGHRSSEQ